MGYESKLIIGTDGGFERRGKRFFYEFARFNLGKIYLDHTGYFRRSNYYFYNGDRQCSRDLYNEVLPVAHADAAIKWLQRSGDAYAAIVADTIDRMRSVPSGELLVLHYGY